ncbi:MAG: hypothetical protein RLZZ227_33 [Pseudomonadota bacterium]
MRREGRRSSNIDDRRGQQMAGIGGGGLILLRFLPLLMRSKGGRFVLLIVGGLFLLSYFGLDGGLVGRLTGVSPGTETRPAMTAEQQELADFVSIVLADTEDTWNALFAEQNLDYVEPTLVLFTGAVRSACGTGQAAMGPFYCPLDSQVYIDLSFYDQLRVRHGAAGDFAQAYVIAHEVGHHVQNLLGIADQVNAQQGRLSGAQSNQLSVLQDFRPTASLACGRIMRIAHGRFWKRATSKKRSERHRRSATTRCSNRPRAMCAPNPSHTAPRSNACSGSRLVSSKVHWKAATPSTDAPARPVFT